MWPPRRSTGARRQRKAGIAPPGERLEPRRLLSADVFTYHNDNARTGQNLGETALAPSNLRPDRFGKVGQVAVDGAVYAQPLVKSGVDVPGRGWIDVVYVATEHDSVYAFDAATLAPVWHDSLINPPAGVTTVPSADVHTTDLFPEIGVTGTPVIDPATQTLYVVAATKAGSGRKPGYAPVLHALDLATGAEKAGGPVVVGAGLGAKFPSRWEFQRSGLLLAGGVVYVSFASYADSGPYHGWTIGYDARTLRRVSAFDVTPRGKQGAIWMSGAAPAADASGHIFVSTGNGTFDADRGGRDYGDSVLRLSAGRKLDVDDFFTPANQAALNAHDVDLGSGGVVALPDQPGPHPHLLVTAGKEGKVYLLDRDDLGRFHRASDRALQEIAGALLGSYGTPAYYNGVLYYVGTAGKEPDNPGGGDRLKAFPVVNGRLGAPTSGPVAYGYPGSTPSVSANGSSGGVVWTLDNGAAFVGPAVLRAYDAADVTRELYDSTQAGLRDRAGVAVKFTVPTVANGRVFVGGLGALTVYGLLPRR